MEHIDARTAAESNTAMARREANEDERRAKYIQGDYRAANRRINNRTWITRMMHFLKNVIARSYGVATKQSVQIQRNLGGLLRRPSGTPRNDVHINSYSKFPEIYTLKT